MCSFGRSIFRFVFFNISDFRFPGKLYVIDNKVWSEINVDKFSRICENVKMRKRFQIWFNQPLFNF